MSNHTERRLHEVIRRIAEEYGSPDELREHAEKNGLSYVKVLEIAYNNIQADARVAIKEPPGKPEQAKARRYTVNDAQGSPVFVITSEEGRVTISSFDRQIPFTERLFLRMIGALIAAALDAEFTIPLMPSASK